MYTLTSPKGHELTGDTLEDLRHQLVDYHLENRRDPQFNDYADQYLAVYPYDESELDEDETPPAPRPLTPEILTGLAGLVWDTPGIRLN